MFYGLQITGLDDRSLPEKRRLKERFLDRFTEQMHVTPNNFLSREPKSDFAKFCQVKYPRMESAFLGDLSQRNDVDSGKFPESEFFSFSLRWQSGFGFCIA